jgi:hypothetical protein
VKHLKIHIDRNKGILGLSQQTYIDEIPMRYGMKKYKSENTPVTKGDKFSLDQYQKIELEKSKIHQIPYASLIGSLMYAHTRSDIMYITGILGRYLNNPNMNHWKAAKRVLRYLQRMKNHMLIYRRSDKLEVIGYIDFDFAGCVDSLKSTSGYIFMLSGIAIFWRSAKQIMIISSIITTEFIACFEASNHRI